MAKLVTMEILGLANDWIIGYFQYFWLEEKITFTSVSLVAIHESTFYWKHWRAFFRSLPDNFGYGGAKNGIWNWDIPWALSFYKYSKPNYGEKLICNLLFLNTIILKAEFGLYKTIQQWPTIKDGIVKMIEGYNKGNISFVLNELEKSDDSLNQQEQLLGASFRGYMENALFTVRDKAMASRIDQLLGQNPNHTFFFAFGAGHFARPKSVIYHLRQAGYTITQVNRSDTWV